MSRWRSSDTRFPSTPPSAISLWSCTSPSLPTRTPYPVAFYLSRLFFFFGGGTVFNLCGVIKNGFFSFLGVWVGECAMFELEVIGWEEWCFFGFWSYLQGFLIVWWRCSPSLIIACNRFLMISLFFGGGRFLICVWLLICMSFCWNFFFFGCVKFPMFELKVIRWKEWCFLSSDNYFQNLL